MKHSAQDGKYHSVGQAVVRDKHPCLDSVLKGVGVGRGGSCMRSRVT